MAPQLGLLNIDSLAGMPLGSAVLARNPAGESLGYPEHGKQNLNSPAAAFQAQKFPSANSSDFAGPAARASPSPTRLPPEASTPAERPSARGARFPSPVRSAVWLPQPACRLTAASSGVGRLGDLDGPADVVDGLALGDQLLIDIELADDLLSCVADDSWLHAKISQAG